MYLHNQDWSAAMRVAERCEPGAVDDIYLAQVRCPPNCNNFRVWVFQGARCSQISRNCLFAPRFLSSSRSQAMCETERFIVVCMHSKPCTYHGHVPCVVIFLAQAAAAAQEQQWQMAESFFLKAKRPDAAIATYREAGQWQAALKLAEAYQPNLIQVRKYDAHEPLSARWRVVPVRGAKQAACATGRGCRKTGTMRTRRLMTVLFTATCSTSKTRWLSTSRTRQAAAAASLAPRPLRAGTTSRAQSMPTLRSRLAMWRAWMHCSSVGSR